MNRINYRDFFLSLVVAGTLWAVSCTTDVDPSGGILDIRPLASPGDYADCIIVTWPAVAQAEGYYLYACDVDVGIYEKVEETPITEESFTFQEVLPYFRYFFKVTAVVDGQETPLSWSASGWAKPSNLTVDTAETSLELSWDAVPGTELYMLEAAMSPDGPFYPMTISADSMVIENPVYLFDINTFAFRFDSSLPRPSVLLRVPSGDSWFRVRAVAEAEGNYIRSFGGVTAWRKP